MFAKAREKARQSSCSSNMKQIGLSLMQYTQDYDETFPVGAAGGPGPCGFNWCNEIYPYVKSWNVFICPDDPLSLPTVGWSGQVVSYVSNGIYAWNGRNYLQGTMGVISDLAGAPQVYVQTSSIQRSAETILVAEQEQVMPASVGQVANQVGCNYSNWPVIRGGGGQTATPWASRAWKADPNDPTGPNGGVTAVHTGLANFVFCDGHVKAMAPYLTNITGNNMWDGTRQ